MTVTNEQQEIQHMQDLLQFGIGVTDGWLWKMKRYDIEGRRKMLQNFMEVIQDTILSKAAALVLAAIDAHLDVFDTLNSPCPVKSMCAFDNLGIAVGAVGYALERYNAHTGHQTVMALFDGPTFAFLPILCLEPVDVVSPTTIQNLQWLLDSVTEEIIPEEYTLQEVINLIKKAMKQLAQ